MITRFLLPEIPFRKRGLEMKDRDMTVHDVGVPTDQKKIITSKSPSIEAP